MPESKTDENVEKDIKVLPELGNEPETPGQRLDSLSTK